MRAPCARPRMRRLHKNPRVMRDVSSFTSFFFACIKSHILRSMRFSFALSIASVIFAKSNVGTNATRSFVRAQLLLANGFEDNFLSIFFGSGRPLWLTSTMRILCFLKV